MRPVLATLLIIAVSVTGVLVGLDLALVVGGRQQPAGQGQANPVSPEGATVVPAFYEAANELLAAHNEWAFTSVASTAVRLHVESGATRGGHEALAAHFLALQKQGDLRLRVARLLGDQHEFTALIEARPPHVALAPADGDPPLWQAIDRFRVDGGMIVDYWPGAVSSRPLPRFPSLSLPLALSEPVVSLARLDLMPGGTLRALTIPTPQLLFVETGSVMLPAPNAIAIARAGDATLEPSRLAHDPDDLSLGPGDAILIPAGSGQPVVNHGDTPASLLSVLFAPRKILYGSRHNLSQDLLLAAAYHDPARTGTKTEWTTGIMSETLAAGALPAAEIGFGTIHLTGRALVVEPGNRIVMSPVPRLRLILVTSGLMSAELAAPATDQAMVATPPVDQDPVIPNTYLLRAGDALAIEPGNRRFLENVGATRLDLAVFEFANVATEPMPTPPCRPSDQTAPDC